MEKVWSYRTRKIIGRAYNETKQALSALGGLAIRAGKTVHRFVHEIERYSLVFAALSVLAVCATMGVDLADRQSERTLRAWQIVRGYVGEVVETGGNRRVGASPSSLRQALEYLNRDFDGFVCASWFTKFFETVTGDSRRKCLFPRKAQESLTGLDVPTSQLDNVYLPGAKLEAVTLYLSSLRGACLWNANLTVANLKGADLSNSDLSYAILSHAKLEEFGEPGKIGIHSDLTGADLTGADLSDATLEKANLGSAILVNTDLAGANLMGAKNLRQEQLDQACGENRPLNIPVGLQWTTRSCPNDVQRVRGCEF